MLYNFIFDWNVFFQWLQNIFSMIEWSLNPLISNYGLKIVKGICGNEGTDRKWNLWVVDDGLFSCSVRQMQMLQE